MLGYGKTDISVIFQSVLESLYTGNELLYSIYKWKLPEEISDVWLYYFDAYRRIGQPLSSGNNQRYATEISSLSGISVEKCAVILTNTLVASRSGKIKFNLSPSKNEAFGTGYVTINSASYTAGNIAESVGELGSKAPEIAENLFDWSKFVVPIALVSFLVWKLGISKPNQKKPR